MPSLAFRPLLRPVWSSYSCVLVGCWVKSGWARFARREPRTASPRLVVHRQPRRKDTSGRSRQPEENGAEDPSCRLEPQEGKKLARQVRGAPVPGGYTKGARGLAKQLERKGKKEMERESDVEKKKGKGRKAWKGGRKERRNGERKREKKTAVT